MVVKRFPAALVWAWCLLGAAFSGWGQDKPPLTESPGAPPEQEVIEITRPEPVRVSMVSTDYLGRVVAARQTPRVGSVAQRSSLEQTITDLSEGKTDAARASWIVCATSIAKENPTSDLEGIVLYILNRSYLQLNPDLTMSAEKVRFFNEQLVVIHQHIAALRKHQSAYTQEEKGKTTIENLSLTSYVPGGTVVRSREREEIAWEELGPRIETWERTLDDVKDEAQLAVFDLQGVMVEHNAIVQAMSVASEVMHAVLEDGLQESAP